MPRTKLDAFNQRGEKIVQLIWGLLDARGLTTNDLAKKTGIGLGVLYRRKKDPESMTLEEYRKICRSLNIPIEDARASGIRY